MQSLIRDIIRLPHKVRVDQDYEAMLHDIMALYIDNFAKKDDDNEIRI